jgi:hypothetical protein
MKLLLKVIVWAVIGFLGTLSALSHSNALAADSAYPRMEPLTAYLMPKNAEIALARSAAPASISKDATVLVLGHHGYVTAVKGTNGFVCMVERGWATAIDFSLVYDPHLRGVDCLNPPAARSILPVEMKMTDMVLAGRSQASIAAAISADFKDGQLPPVEPGAAGIMMSKGSYIINQPPHNFPHVMFFTLVNAKRFAAANLPDVPIFLSPYFFVDGVDRTAADGLPAIQLMDVVVFHWSDGTPFVLK